MAQTEKFKQLKLAYLECSTIAKQHYENFPVASLLLPKHIRLAITAIYAFARIADDYADSPTLTAAEKLTALNYLETALLNDNLANQANQNILLAVKDTIQQHRLPITLFLQLLTAFKQDITQTSYDDCAALLLYCNNSANPIGRLLLHLMQQANPENLQYADHICTSLQLLNFIQDLPNDLHNLNRCYIPLQDLAKFQVTIDELKAQKKSNNIAKLIQYQLKRCQTILQQGLPLSSRLTGSFALEVQLIIAGANKILQKLYTRTNYYQRPTLHLFEKITMLVTVLFAIIIPNKKLIMVDK